MNLRRQYLRDSINQIRRVLGVDVDYESKSIYLKKDDDIIGLHATMAPTEDGLIQMEGWCNAYSNDFKYIGSIYRIFGPIEEEAAELKKDGWVEIEAPA